MEKDTLDTLLEHDKVYSRLSDRKEQLRQIVIKLLECYTIYHGKRISRVKIEILQKLIWDIIRVDPVIMSFYFSHSQFGLTDIETFGGCISRKITALILEDAIAEGLIK